MMNALFNAASAKAKPAIRPGAYRTQRTRPITPGETVYLDGAALLDAAALGEATRFAWSFLRRPVRSRAVLVQGASCRAYFNPDVSGRYLVRLDARTEAGNLHVVKEVRVSQDEMTPVAVAKAESSLVMAGAPIRLYGSSSENPLAGSLAYEWRISAAPMGSIATLSYAASESPMIFPDLTGRYEITLTVRNAAGVGTSDRVVVDVVSSVALSDLAQINSIGETGGINFGRTYSTAELDALKRTVRFSTTRCAEAVPPTVPAPARARTRAQEARPSSPQRYASLVGHIRMLLRDGVDSITRQVDSAHDFQQPAVSRR